MPSSIRSRTERALAVALVCLLAGAPAAGASEPIDAAGRRLTEQGQRAYETGRFDDAIVAYDAAYQRAPLPGFLFNLAQCHRQKGDRERALFLYQRYLDLAPSARNSSVAQEWVRRLRQPQQVAARPASDRPEREREEGPRTASFNPSPRHAADAPAVPEPIYSRWYFWAGVGTALAAGTALAVVAAQPGTRPASLGTGDLR